MRGLLTYAQKTPVSPLRLIQDPGSRGFVLKIRMVSHHHRLSIWQLVTRKRRLLILRRQVVSARTRVVARLHHLHILLLLLMLLLLLLLVLVLMLMLLLRMRWLVVMMLLGVLRVCHVHRGRDADILRDDRRSFVHGYLARYLAHRNALWGVELVVGRRGVWIVGLLREEIMFVRVRY